MITLIMPSKGGGGEGLRFKIIIYYIVISAQIIFKVVRDKSSYNELDMTYND